MMFEAVMNAVLAMMIILLWSAALITGTARFISNRLTSKTFCQWLWSVFHPTMDDDDEGE